MPSAFKLTSTQQILIYQEHSKYCNYEVRVISARRKGGNSTAVLITSQLGGITTALLAVS